MGAPSKRAPLTYQPGQLLVIPAEPPRGDLAARSIAGLQVRDWIPPLNLFVVNVPPGQEEAWLETLRQDPAIRVVERNGLVWTTDARRGVVSAGLHDLLGWQTGSEAGPLAVTDDPAFGLQWNLPRIQAPQAWDTTTGSAVVIAVLDTGVDLDHPDLQGKLMPGYDFVNKDNSPADDNGFGTFEAGVAAAMTNNERGVAGTSWGAQILPVKVLGSDAVGNYADVISGIVWAVDHDADIISMAFGGTLFSVGMQAAVDYAISNGVVVVASVGDEGADGNPVIYPAGLSGVLGVTAIDRGDTRLATAGYGSSIDFVDLTAPGESIISTWWHDGAHDYGTATGTNFATSHVAGIAALMLSINPTLPPVQVANILQTTAHDLGVRGRDRYFGFGLVDTDAALRATPHFLQVSPDQLIFRDDGQTISPATARITNHTTSAQTWTARVPEADADWLTVSAPTGPTPSSVTVGARRNQNPACFRVGHIIIESRMADSVNSPQTVTVVMRSSGICHRFYMPLAVKGLQ
jgi:subtilisin family serine protease